MNNGEFSSEIIAFTAKNSNYQIDRNYISLSHIYLPAELKPIKTIKKSYSPVHHDPIF
jgi:hypothetical protein